MNVSVIICTHNPRSDYLRRTLEGLKAQTLPQEQWELLLIDNASKEPLANNWDLSWHSDARHVREDELGLTAARLRGIAEAGGDILVFVDDDNILAPDYLERAAVVPGTYAHLGVFGAGVLVPEFEVEPDPVVRPRLSMLALRVVPQALWTNHIGDYFCAPHGAGLCVPRQIAARYSQLVQTMRTSHILDRCGENLFCGGDDLFSWLSSDADTGFGILPELRITHLISAGRVRQDYFVRLGHGHTFSHGIIDYLLQGISPVPPKLVDWLRSLAHGLKNGWFSMRCDWASLHGRADAAEFIRKHKLQPLPPEKRIVVCAGGRSMPAGRETN